MAEEPFDVVLPPELEEGSYAEQLSGWFTPEGFVLDFTARSRERELLVTSRVRLPATAAIEARRALDELIREYELQYGEIHRPRNRGTRETDEIKNALLVLHPVHRTPIQGTLPRLRTPRKGTVYRVYPRWLDSRTGKD